jgi:tetratricopeptide (TPR) repeat protein
MIAQREGDNSFGSEQYEEAIKHYKEGCDICAKTKNKRHQIYFLIQLGICFMRLEQLEDAVNSFEKCIELCEDSIYFKSGIEVAEGHLKSIYSKQGKTYEPKPHYKDKNQISKPIVQEETRKVLLITEKRKTGDMFFAKRQYGEALKEYQEGRAAAIQEKRKSDQSYLASQIGLCLGYLKDYQQAIENFNEYIELSRELNFPKGIAAGEANIGWVFSLQDKASEARAHYKLALEIRLQLGDEAEAAKLRKWIGEGE